MGIAGARDDDDFVIGIAAHVAKGLGKLAVRQQTPLQRSAAGVKRHLEDAVAPFHADRLVLRRVVVKACHEIPSPARSKVSSSKGRSTATRRRSFASKW